ncbi:hypothetical protein HZA85_00245 [Candidatus Uhrbacteria bacterium]|nr:hypothetical protein [Candidatus Uhrbacteria bacterium]
MTTAQLIRVFPLVLYAFVAWVAVLFLLSLSLTWPRAAFIAIHIAATVGIYWFVFRAFYDVHHQARPYPTTIFVLVSVFVFDAILFGFFVENPARFLNFPDWIFPIFLMATTVYAAGRKHSR